jgi:hypothetical protein
MLREADGRVPTDPGRKAGPSILAERHPEQRAEEGKENGSIFHARPFLTP